jgi:hypothetical protein
VQFGRRTEASARATECASSDPTKMSRSPKSRVKSSIGIYSTQVEEISGPENHQTGPGKRHIDGKDFHLADEIRYIQRRAAEHDGRFVTVGSLALFSTDTGDAWLLDPEDPLAARLARDGDPEDVYFEETDAPFAIGWKGEYRIDGSAFVYIDRDSGRIVTILGYPIHRIAEWG